MSKQSRYKPIGDTSKCFFCDRPHKQWSYREVNSDPEGFGKLSRFSTCGAHQKWCWEHQSLSDEDVIRILTTPKKSEMPNSKVLKIDTKAGNYVLDIDGVRYRFDKVDHIAGNSMILMSLVQSDDPEFRKVVYNPKDTIGNYIEQNLARHAAKEEFVGIDYEKLFASETEEPRAESSGRGPFPFESSSKDPQGLGLGAVAEIPSEEDLEDEEDLGQSAQGIDLSDLCYEDLLRANGLDPDEHPKEKTWQEKALELDSVPVPKVEIGPHLEPGEILGTRQKKLKVAK
jgi:hypothetical protein